MEKLSNPAPTPTPAPEPSASGIDANNEQITQPSHESVEDTKREVGENQTT